MDKNEIISELKRTLENNLSINIRKIFLFGSQITGNANRRFGL